MALTWAMFLGTPLMPNLLTWLPGFTPDLLYHYGLVWQSLGSWLTPVPVTRSVPLTVLGTVGLYPPW